MDAKREKYQYNNRMYISGSTARNLSVVTERERWEETEPQRDYPVRKTRNTPKPSRKPAVSRGINFVSMLVLTLAIGVTLFVCIEYLTMQSKIVQIDKEIINLEKDLTKLQDTNNIIKNTLAASIDLDNVYEVAVGELGMVYPNKNKVITYKKNNVGYVRQYGEIPEVDALNLLEQLMP